MFTTHLFQFGLWNSAHTVCAKISILFLNTSEAADVLVAGFLPLCYQVFIGNVLAQAIFVQLYTQQHTHRFTSFTPLSRLSTAHQQQCKTSFLSMSLLADRTNGRAYATVLRLSVRLSVICDVMYCG